MRYFLNNSTSACHETALTSFFFTSNSVLFNHFYVEEYVSYTVAGVQGTKVMFWLHMRGASYHVVGL